MKTREEVSADKLRGGFYSPPALVTRCLDRVSELLGPRNEASLLEPTVGDGAFFRGLAQHPLSGRVRQIRAVELVDDEAAKAEASLDAMGLEGRVYRGSFLPWAIDHLGEFDAAVGNPPFIRFQFVSPDDRMAAIALSESLSIPFRGVSNLWISVLVGALACLKPGGVFAFIVPTELLTGISAATVRRWLEVNASELRVDLYPPGSFPDVLQEIVILSGVVGRGALYEIKFVENAPSGTFAWSHGLRARESTWTQYLLTPHELEALSQARSASNFRALGTVARFEVAAVTGANGFFSVGTETVERYGLTAWSIPMLPRTRHVAGLRFSGADHDEIAQAGERTWLLDFSATKPNPEEHPKPAEYLRTGLNAGLHDRYKTSIRHPWYRVPHIRAGRLMLSKRSHYHPRLILNDALAVTTDTVYRGWMRTGYEQNAEALVAGFHNSITLLTAEVEGRSFGGGVLELVPSEIARLCVPMIPALGARLDDLSASVRRRGAVDGSLIEATNDLISLHERIDRDMIGLCERGRSRLQARRLARNSNGRSNGHSTEYD